MELINHRWAKFQIVNLGTFMSTLDVGIVNVVLPTMAEQFGVSLSQIQWVVTAYLLTMVALLPLLGKLSDRLDRSQVYSAGFFVFALGSLLIGLSGSLATIVAARIVQGVGAAMIMANSQAMVRKLFPNHEIGKALSMNAVVISVGTLSGPAVGGLLMEAVSWSWLFYINVPLGLAAVYCGLKWFPHDKKRAFERLDYIGALLLALSTILLLFGAVTGEREGFTPAVIALYSSGAVLLLLLFAYERKIPHRIVDSDLYKIKAIAVGNSVSLLNNVMQMATLLPLTFYMQQVLGYPTKTLGLVLAIQPVFLGIASPASGWYRDKYGAFLPAVAGSLLFTLSTLFIVLGSTIQLTGIILFLAVSGIGIGLFVAINNAEVMSAAPAEKISLVGSMIALIRYYGMIIGIAFAVWFAGGMGTELTAAPNPALTAQIKLLFLFCMALGLLMTFLCYIRPRQAPSSRMTRKASGKPASAAD
ncbi:MFS transporter [Paenibacillus senegalensis]|uniref:MFS transporter n=1 Tax=Paenibacillus senegalensis TaxID=1465766 RepID=UPI0002892378|nr:MFS transporter [Paenibacillus senegalensis]